MFESFHRWLDKKLRIDGYEMRDGEIVTTGILTRRIPLAGIRSWQSFYIGGGTLSIRVEFADGRKLDYSDRYEQLLNILRGVAAEKELPFFTA